MAAKVELGVAFAVGAGVAFPRVLRVFIWYSLCGVFCVFLLGKIFIRPGSKTSPHPSLLVCGGGGTWV